MHVVGVAQRHFLRASRQRPGRIDHALLVGADAEHDAIS